MLTAAAAFAAGAALVAAFLPRPVPPAAEIVRFDVAAPPGMEILAYRPSPDGRRLLIAESAAGRRRLQTYSFDTATFTPIPGTQDATPFVSDWSPDGREIIFSTEGRLRRVGLDGGPPQIVASLPSGSTFGGDWGAHDDIILGSTNTPILHLSLREGGDPKPVTTLDADAGELGHRFPHFLPDGRHFLYLATSAGGHQAFVGALDAKTRVHLPGIASQMKYAPSGHILFLRDGALMMQAFDADNLTLSGTASVLQDRIVDERAVSGSFYSTPSGLFSVRILPEPVSVLTWFDRRGLMLGAATPPASFTDIELSPDDRHVVFERGTPGDIWTIDLQSGVSERVTTNPAREADPVWSHDGRAVLFRADGDGGRLNTRAFGAVGEDTPFHKGDTRESPGSWSLDGRYIAFHTTKGLFGAAVTGDREPFQVAPALAEEGQISPDGRWIAFASSEAGRREVYVQSFPKPGARRQVSVAGGTGARWSRDSREIFYRADDDYFMAVTIAAQGDSISLSTPKRLFTTPMRGGGEGGYAVSSDGRFLVNVPVAGSVQPPITVFLNWAANVKR